MISLLAAAGNVLLDLAFAFTSAYWIVRLWQKVFKVEQKPRYVKIGPHSYEVYNAEGDLLCYVRRRYRDSWTAWTEANQRGRTAQTMKVAVRLLTEQAER